MRSNRSHSAGRRGMGAALVCAATLLTVVVQANGAPTVPTTVNIVPSKPSTDDNLVASASGSIGGIGPLTYRFQWAKSTDGGTTWSGWDWTGVVLASGLTTRDELWKVRARASDGVAVSPWLESAPVTVHNTAPFAPTGVSISPRPPRDSQDLRGTAIGSADIDGDALTYRYKWYKSTNGGTTWVGSLTKRVLPAASTNVGEMWKVAARADDGGKVGPWTESDPVTILADAP